MKTLSPFILRINKTLNPDNHRVSSSIWIDLSRGLRLIQFLRPNHGASTRRARNASVIQEEEARIIEHDREAETNGRSVRFHVDRVSILFKAHILFPRVSCYYRNACTSSGHVKRGRVSTGGLITCTGTRCGRGYALTRMKLRHWTRENNLSVKIAKTEPDFPRLRRHFALAHGPETTNPERSNRKHILYSEHLVKLVHVGLKSVLAAFLLLFVDVQEIYPFKQIFKTRSAITSEAIQQEHHYHERIHYDT